MSREFYVPCTPYAYQIKSKLPNFGNPLKRFMKSKSPKEISSEENVNHLETSSHIPERIDELANSAAYSDASMLNEQSTSKSNTSVYRPEYTVADAARTRESRQDLASYFSEVDPDEPSTSATNTELSASTFDRDVEGTESSENPRSTTVTSTTSTSFGSELTETVSNSMNTEEVSDAELMDVLQRGTIIAVAPVAFSTQLGNEISNVSGTMESRTRDQRIGRDDPREFYDRTLRMVIRKPISPAQEDEPSIY